MYPFCFNYPLMSCVSAMCAPSINQWPVTLIISSEQRQKDVAVRKCSLSLPSSPRLNIQHPNCLESTNRSGWIRWLKRNEFTVDGYETKSYHSG